MLWVTYGEKYVAFAAFSRTIELEKMTVSSAQFKAKERMADDVLDEYGPEEEKTVELKQQNLSSDTGEDNVIIIEE